MFKQRLSRLPLLVETPECNKVLGRPYVGYANKVSFFTGPAVDERIQGGEYRRPELPNIWSQRHQPECRRRACWANAVLYDYSLSLQSRPGETGRLNSIPATRAGSKRLAA